MVQWQDASFALTKRQFDSAWVHCFAKASQCKHPAKQNVKTAPQIGQFLFTYFLVRAGCGAVGCLLLVYQHVVPALAAVAEYRLAGRLGARYREPVRWHGRETDHLEIA